MNYNFAQDLKSIREILGLTQEEFASQIGVEQVTISRNELGKTVPSVRLLDQVYELRKYHLSKIELHVHMLQNNRAPHERVIPNDNNLYEKSYHTKM